MGGNLQLLFKCHFLNWLPGAGLQNASCGPGAVLGSPQGRSLLSLRGRCHCFLSLAERRAQQEVERGVKPQLVTIETLDSHASPQSFQDAFCRVSEDLAEKLLGGYWAWPGGFGSSFSILGAPQTRGVIVKGGAFLFLLAPPSRHQMSDHTESAALAQLSVFTFPAVATHFFDLVSEEPAPAPFLGPLPHWALGLVPARTSLCSPLSPISSFCLFTHSFSRCFSAYCH